MMDLLLTVAMLCEFVTEFQFLWETSLVADGSGSMHQGPEHGMLTWVVV
jgi:hypothetical protein